MGRKPLNVTGQVFGKLTAIRGEVRLENDGHTRAHWLCRCECGNEKWVRLMYLTRGITKSCGCLIAAGAGWRSTLRDGDIDDISLAVDKGRARLESHVYLVYKSAACKRGYEWALTRQEVTDLSQQVCHYCGAEPSNIRTMHDVEGVLLYNGLDRVDNMLGYTRDNVVPCCGVCNRAKLNMSYSEFMAWITRVYKHLLEESSARAE